MSNALIATAKEATTTAIPSAAAIEAVLIRGDLSGLTELQRLAHYKNVCDSLGLNPLTQPLDYIKLNGKLVLYAKRDAAEQLRKIHGVSIEAIGTERFEDVYIVTAKAKDKTGRTDVSTGAVPFNNLRGEALANAFMKAETKAKRRVTLSICGLGMLDETEVESVMAATAVVAPEPPKEIVNVTTGEVVSADIQRPTPPDGYDYIERYWQEGTWFHVVWQGQEYKTKVERVGAPAEQAYQDGVPVRCYSKKFPWLDRVERWRPAAAVVNNDICAHCGAPVTACSCHATDAF